MFGERRHLMSLTGADEAEGDNDEAEGTHDCCLDERDARDGRRSGSEGKVLNPGAVKRHGGALILPAAVFNCANIPLPAWSTALESHPIAWVDLPCGRSSKSCAITARRFSNGCRCWASHGDT